MSTSTLPVRTLADLLNGLGSIPLERIPFPPAPGMATEADVFMRPGGEKRIYELIDGVLVEKPMGFYESVLAAVLIQRLGTFVERYNLSIVLGEAGTLRLAPGQVRVPDVSFISWSRFPNREFPAEPIPDLAPDLAVEVLSDSNTEGEMERKLHDYFEAGVRLVWYLEPRTRTARVYTSQEDVTHLDESGILEGGAVLPHFTLRVGEWLDKAGRRRS